MRGATASRCSTRLESGNGLRGGMFVTPHHPGGTTLLVPASARQLSDKAQLLSAWLAGLVGR